LILRPKLGIFLKLTLLCIFLKLFLPAGAAVAGLAASSSLLGSLPRRPANDAGGVGGGLLGAANLQLSAISMLAEGLAVDARENVGLGLLTQHGHDGTPVEGRAYIVVGETTDSSKIGAGVAVGSHMGAVGSDGRKEKMEARLPGRFHIGGLGLLELSSAKRRWRKYLGAMMFMW
jgi:hypothetical protein